MREGRDSRRREMGNHLEGSINLYNGSIFWDHVSLLLTVNITP